ncbi:hypothetical protein [Candidatus Nitrosotenuis cloacae]|uniref:hypothetical protein n=1 Tax=Candidatus Nitrosotenuis cloacae TaxID=1603555 RepID=UPI002281C20F|nr:hypothetical protein [Candidatus Nitrosotenuis cloacae]
MAGKIIGLMVISVLLAGAITSVIYDTSAEAKPSSKSPKHKFSKWNKHVCGDELCPADNYMKTKRNIGKSQTPR